MQRLLPLWVAPSVCPHFDALFQLALQASSPVQQARTSRHAAASMLLVPTDIDTMLAFDFLRDFGLLSPIKELRVPKDLMNPGLEAKVEAINSHIRLVPPEQVRSFACASCL